jgi:dihydroxyacetone kinase
VKLGGAGLGDKTMLDALLPFVDAFRESVARGAEVPAAWAEASAVATASAATTSDLRPMVGRARPLAERSIGHPDPGAVSFALAMTAIGGALISSKGSPQ